MSRPRKETVTCPKCGKEIQRQTVDQIVDMGYTEC